MLTLVNRETKLESKDHLQVCYLLTELWQATLEAGKMFWMPISLHQPSALSPSANHLLLMSYRQFTDISRLNFVRRLVKDGSLRIVD
jgi:hypothetical protein